MVDDIVGGPGWVIGGVDLRPVIIQMDIFTAALHDDPLLEPLVLLWSDHPQAALDLLQRTEATQRVRALRADCLRDLGNTAEAVHEYNLLVEETAGTAQEAVMRQHRGKARLANHEVEAAIDDFVKVVGLRAESDPTLLASATQALQVALARRTWCPESDER